MPKKTENENEIKDENGAEVKTGVAEQPESESADAPAMTEEELFAKLAEYKAASEEYKRKWYAVSAEYDNYRKRTAASSAAAYQDGKAEAILKLLPVSDTFGYAYDGASDEKTKTGIDKIIKNFNAILNSLGVEEIPVNAGDKFDESVMEAVMNASCEEGEQPNTVKNILKKGYRQNGKVIRFAQVIVTTE